MDMLLHLCFHFTYHHGCALGLKGLCDIAEVISSYPGRLNWEDVARYAHDYKIEPHLYAAVHLAEKVLGTEIPRWVMSSFAKSCSKAQIRWLENLTPKDFLKHLHCKKITPLARLFWINRFWDKRRFIFTVSLPAKETLALGDSFPLSSKRIYTFYLVRSFHLLFKRLDIHSLQNLYRFLKN